MSANLSFTLRKAFEIPPGQVVIRPGDPLAVGIKLHQVAKEFLRHYLLPLHPPPEEGLRLEYLDPEEELVDCGGPLRFELGAEAPITPGLPHPVFRNGRGTFLRVIGAERAYTMSEAQRLYQADNFVELTSREVLARQDRNLKGHYPDFRILGMGGPSGVLTLPEVRTAYQKSRSA